MFSYRLAPILAFLIHVPSGCGSSAQKTSTPKAEDEKEPVAKDSEEEKQEDEIKCVVAGKGKISATTLKGFLKKGPGYLLQKLGVEREPPTGQGPFRGWRVTGVRHPCLARALKSQDIIVSVNGASISRPGQLWKLWVAMKEATHLDLVLEREGKVLRRRYEISD